MATLNSMSAVCSRIRAIAHVCVWMCAHTPVEELRVNVASARWLDFVAITNTAIRRNPKQCHKGQDVHQRIGGV